MVHEVDEDAAALYAVEGHVLEAEVLGERAVPGAVAGRVVGRTDQVDFVTDALVYARDQGCDVIEVDPAAEDGWSAMIERNVSRQSFTEKSYYFGTNIPGKPRRFLLNSGGRPKLHREIAKVKESDYKAFRLSRSAS